VALRRQTVAWIILAILATSTMVSAATESSPVQARSVLAKKTMPRPEPGSFVPGELLMARCVSMRMAKHIY